MRIVYSDSKCFSCLHVTNVMSQTWYVVRSTPVGQSILSLWLEVQWMEVIINRLFLVPIYSVLLLLVTNYNYWLLILLLLIIMWAVERWQCLSLQIACFSVTSDLSYTSNHSNQLTPWDGIPHEDPVVFQLVKKSRVLWNQKLNYHHCINQQMHSVNYNKIRGRVQKFPAWPTF